MHEFLTPGDWVVLWGGERANYLVSYSPGKKFSTHLGELILPEKIAYGDSLVSKLGKKFYLIRPRACDLAMKVKRTTTILYPKDVGYMLLMAGIGASSKVIEVGTGSGAFTIVLAHAVGSQGKVYSFERRKEFLENAKTNVEKAKLLDRIVFFLQDPELAGFGIRDVDAVFVDVPEPWTLVNAAYQALKGGGSFVSLSPNIEQIKKTYEALQDKFTRIQCGEILFRDILIRPEGIRPRERMISHTGYLLFANKVNQ